MQSIRYLSAVHRILSLFLSIFANRRRVHNHRRARVHIRVLFAAVSVNCFTYFVYIICYRDGGICFIYTCLCIYRAYIIYNTCARFDFVLYDAYYRSTTITR